MESGRETYMLMEWQAYRQTNQKDRQADKQTCRHTQAHEKTGSTGRRKLPQTGTGRHRQTWTCTGRKADTGRRRKTQANTGRHRQTERQRISIPTCITKSKITQYYCTLVDPCRLSGT
jgi:hypothetical protein